MKAKTSFLTAGVLMAAMFAASPAAMAQDQGMKKQGGKWDQKEMCENFREGKGKFSAEYREERQAEMQKYRAEMAVTDWHWRWPTIAISWYWTSCCRISTAWMCCVN